MFRFNSSVDDYLGLAHEPEHVDRDTSRFRLYWRGLQRWMREAGFNETRVEPLCGPDSMVVGIK